MEMFKDGSRIKYEVIYRSVKNPRIELRFDSIRLILPRDFRGKPEDLLISKRDWIERKLHEHEEMLRIASDFELHGRGEDEFRSLVMGFLGHYSGELGVTYGRVRFRRMRSRWGSCSSRGNLSFNTLISYLPDELVEYVVLHELAHMLEMNHSRRFWGILEYHIPDWRDRRNILRYYWVRLHLEGLTD
ncbi:M48 family metallopeptidase [Methanothermobacter sp. KEPCO 2]|uniref:M48 family metallopeptidase n=1 Tax=Methanothermobacter sp. KEPCO 2 TaxID=3240977 RepID=UPI003514057C